MTISALKESLQAESMLEINTNFSPLNNTNVILSSIYDKIINLENQYQELNSFLETIKSHLSSLESFHEKRIKELKEINEARLIIIEEQQRMINSRLRLNILATLKNFCRKGIGNLYHHKARPMKHHYTNEQLISNPPTISIVTPSFNQGRFLEKTILSVLDQNYPAIEYIIQDSESTDETINIIKTHESKIKYWESKKDTGQSNAINLGFRHATGEIMAYLNSDDILLPGSLSYVAKFFIENPEVDVVYGHRILIDEYDGEVGRWIIPSHDSEVLTWADFIPQETLFWRRKIWDITGGYIDENFKFAMDWELLLRFKEAGAHFKRLPRFLGAFRIHPHQKTSSQMISMGQEEMARLRKRCHGRFVSHPEVRKNIRNYILKNIVYQKLYSLGILRY